MAVPPLWLPYILSFNLSKGFLLIAIALLIIFLRHYFKRPLRPVTLGLLITSSLIFVFLMLVLPKTIAEAQMMFNYIILIPAFLGILYIGYLAYSGIREHLPTAHIVFWGAVLAVAVGMQDMIFSFLNIIPKFWLQGFSIILFDFSIFIALIFRTVHVFKQLEDHTAKVEEAVETRTKELDVINRELELALANARKANRAKNEFLANVSHEIRTPLNCIIGFAEIVAKESIDSELKEYSGMIVDRGVGEAAAFNK